MTRRQFLQDAGEFALTLTGLAGLAHIAQGCAGPMNQVQRKLKKLLNENGLTLDDTMARGTNSQNLVAQSMDKRLTKSLNSFGYELDRVYSYCITGLYVAASRDYLGKQEKEVFEIEHMSAAVASEGEYVCIQYDVPQIRLLDSREKMLFFEWQKLVEGESTF
ncbi:hypothetical protein HN587_03315 [Candidatus Woesearchaeota archaeon]|jgi:hypothetical protein|nr:hypothetical protein [Candidatus Woesearchaeota archaeon]